MWYRHSISNCSKAPWGLSVLSRVTCIFTGTKISPSLSLRQCPNHYAFRAGRNLPDKEFRYLRTVIVTAAVYWGFGSELRFRSLLPLTFQHRAGVTPYTSACAFAESCVFGKQSLGPFFCGSPLSEHPFSLSYGVILQSSLAAVLSLTSGFSPCPCVSIFGTGRMSLLLEAFPGRCSSAFRTCLSFPYASRLPLIRNRFSLVSGSLAYTGSSVRRHRLASPSLLHRHTGTGISTRLPSAAPLGLTLGPDSPRVDEPSPGILGQSVCGILTHISLLTPAFSLPCAPAALPVCLRRCMERSPTAVSCPELRCHA